MFNSLFGKYRFLVVSIALFLIFDLGVLLLNFYTSGKISEQTQLIDAAASQRTLTQQMSKATLYLKSQKLQSWVYQSGLDELRDHYQTFDQTLVAFNEGGTINSPRTGLPISIPATEDVAALTILSEANGLWKGFESAIDPLMIDTLVSDNEIEPASDFIAANNLRMFELMDQLTEFFKAKSEKQTSLLRTAQVIGISLATINFFVILFHFLGQLRTRDRALKIKQHESDQILSTINEGVFLLDENLVMSGQHSKQLRRIFLSKHFSGRDFQEFLGRYVPKKTVETALDFVALYFRNHIDTSLIEDVNPLKRVEALITTKNGEAKTKFLDFSFAALDQKEKARTILVTVRDVSERVLLEEQGQKNADDIQQQMAMLTQILPVPSDDLEVFIDEGRESLNRVNDLLKNNRRTKDSDDKTLSRIAREVHKFKGNASALNLSQIVENNHLFESSIDELRKRSKLDSLDGQDFLPLTIQLKEIFEHIDLIEDMRQKLVQFAAGNPDDRENSLLTISDGNVEHSQPASSRQGVAKKNKKWFGLHSFTQRLAAKEDILVDLNLRGLNKPLSKALSEPLYSIAVQLIRNSIAHGVESEQQRLRIKKPSSGSISISISHDKAGNYRFLFEDDGRKMPCLLVVMLMI